jgi:hypothetical protein
MQLVCDYLGELHVLLDQQDRDASVAQQANDARKLPHHERRKALARLVEEQNLRIADERPRDRQHLLLAAGKLGTAVALALAERGKEGEQALDGPGLGGVRSATRMFSTTVRSGNISRPSGT